MLTREKALNFIDMPLFYLSALFMLLAGVFVAADFNHIFTYSAWLPMGICLFVISFYNGKYGLYLLTFLLSFIVFGFGQSQDFIMLNIFFLVGAYASLAVENRFSKLRFLINIKNRDVLVLFVALWFLVSLIGIIGAPMFSLLEYYFGSANECDCMELFRSALLNIVCLLGLVYFLGIAKGANKIGLIKNILLSLFFGMLFAFLPDIFFKFDPQPLISHAIFLVPLLPLVLLFFRESVSGGDRMVLTLAATFSLTVVLEIALIYYKDIAFWVAFPVGVFLIWMYVFYILAKQKDASLVTFFTKKSRTRLLGIVLLSSLFLLSLVLAVQNFSQHPLGYDRSWSELFQAFFIHPVFGSGSYEVSSQSDYHISNMYHELLLGRGAFGVAVFVGMIWVVLYRLTVKELSLGANRLKSFEETLAGISIAGSLAVMSVFGLTDKLFSVYPFQFLFWLLVFCGIVLTKKVLTSREDRKHFRSSFRFLFGFLLFLIPLHLLTVPFVKDNVSVFVTNHLGFLGAFTDNTVYLIVLSSLGISFMAMFVNLFIINYSYKDKVFMDDTIESKAHAMHKVPTPRVGGIGIFMANIFLVFFPLGLQFIVVTLIAFVTGLLDDIRSISPKLRLVLQALSAVAFITVFGYMIDRIGFGIELPLWFALPFTVFAMVGVTNAVNIIDGLNGLAGGVAFLVLAGFGYVAFSVHDVAMLKIIVVNIMAVFGFLLINYPRGKIFMGDGGAYFVGFSLVALSIMLFSRHPEVSPLYTVAMVIYPVFEVIYSIYRRKVLRSGDSTKADRLHLHSLLHKRVFRSNPKTSLFIWLGVTPFLVLASLFYDNDIVCAGTIVLFCVTYVYVYGKVLLKVR